ncbi:hypothetical protein [Bradyrhizobium sp. JR3.5]
MSNSLGLSNVCGRERGALAFQDNVAADQRQWHQRYQQPEAVEASGGDAAGNHPESEHLEERERQINLSPITTPIIPRRLQ